MVKGKNTAGRTLGKGNAKGSGYNMKKDNKKSNK